MISAFCRMARVGPAFDPIPLRPVVHYHMSGIAVDTAGRRMIESLLARGETSRTGLYSAIGLQEIVRDVRATIQMLTLA